MDVEVDERQHEDYTVVCETARMAKIYEARRLQGNTLPMVFLRINPHKFKVNGKSVNGLYQKRRNKALVHLIKGMDLTQAQPLQIIYLYYDAITINDQLVPAVTQDPDYNPSLAAVSSWLAP